MVKPFCSCNINLELSMLKLSILCKECELFINYLTFDELQKKFFPKTSFFS